MSLNREKGKLTQVDLVFQAIHRNRFIQLYYLDTVDNLAAILSTRSPV
jgi:hypothetical protein